MPADFAARDCGTLHLEADTDYATVHLARGAVIAVWGDGSVDTIKPPQEGP